MKKLIPVMFLLILPLSLSAQWYGDGKTPGTAYYGVINGSYPMQVWNTTDYPPGDYPGGVIYVGQTSTGNQDLTIGNGGTLTIQDGITVKFCTTISDLIITGTGVLNASSSASNGITFTKNTLATWGHISFQAMDILAGASVINNCLITYGSVNSAPGVDNPNRYGGAIHAAHSNLTISNCEIHNNRAGWGGGIFVGDGKNPTISNCYIHDNTATTSGGGVYFWRNSYSTCSNSIITNNSSTGTGGGGGIFIGGTAKDVKVINCVISGNSATSQSLGHNIKIFNNSNTPKPQFINSIIWNPANSIVGSIYAADFLNCAIQNPPLATYTSCISLNALNEGTNPSGPNFNATDGTDWSLKFISPCRDAGVSTYTGVNIPSTDYINNPRIGTKDIGAYEVQYSRWRTDASSPTSWTNTGNWEQNLYPGLAGTTGDAVIPALINDTYAPNIPGTVSITSGKYFILEPGAKATINTISNSGILKLMSDANSIFSLIVTTYTANAGGTEQIELYLEGKELSGVDKWHYISSPVSSLPVSTFSPTPTENLAQFVESLPTNDNEGLVEGWIAYDGYSYALGEIPIPTLYTFNVLSQGQGYNYFHTANNKYTFSGDLNNSDVSKTLAYTGTPDSPLRGFNLLGNPFSSGLDWDFIANGTYPSNTSKAIHFTQNNVQCDYINGTGTFGATGIIPPMQGFFIKANNTPDIQLTIPAEARVHNLIHARYKGESVIPLIRLTVSQDAVTSDETIIRFDELAKTGVDYDFDAVKMFVSETSASIYSSLNGTKYSINGQPFPTIETVSEIPIMVNLITAGTFKISSTQLQGLDNYRVTLTDNVTGFTADLKTTEEITFTASPGLLTGRFVLKVGNITTGEEGPAHAPGTFSIYHEHGFINILPIEDGWNGISGSVKVMDLSGRTINVLNNVEFNRNSLIQVSAPTVRGLYILELRSGVKRFSGKVVIR